MEHKIHTNANKTKIKRTNVLEKCVCEARKKKYFVTLDITCKDLREKKTTKGYINMEDRQTNPDAEEPSNYEQPDQIYILKSVHTSHKPINHELQEEKSNGGSNKKSSERGWFIATIVLLVIFFLFLIALIVWICVAPVNSWDCSDCVCDGLTNVNGKNGPSCAMLLLQRENEISELNKQIQRHNQDYHKMRSIASDVRVIQTLVQERLSREASTPSTLSTSSSFQSSSLSVEMFTDLLRQLSNIMEQSMSFSPNL